MAPVARLRSPVFEPDAHRTRLAVGPCVVGNSRYPGSMGLSFARMHGAVEPVFPTLVRRGGPCLSLQYGHASEQIRLRADGWLLTVQHEVSQVNVMIVCLLDAVE